MPITAKPEARIKIPSDWTQLLKMDAHRAKQELARTRDEFQQNFDKGLVCAGFERGDGATGEPQYLFYRSDVVMQ